MNCKKYQEWISAGLDGMLDEQQARFLQEHLAACPACRQVKADLERTIALIRALPEIKPPPDLLASIHQRIATESKTGRMVWRILALPQTRVALAAALLMIVVIYGYQPMSLVTRDMQADGKDKGQGVVGKELPSKPAELVRSAAAEYEAGGRDKRAQEEGARLEPAPVREMKKEKAQQPADGKSAADADNLMPRSISPAASRSPAVAQADRSRAVMEEALPLRELSDQKAGGSKLVKAEQPRAKANGVFGAVAQKPQEVFDQERAQVHEDRQSAAMMNGVRASLAAVPAAPSAQAAAAQRQQRSAEKAGQYAQASQSAAGGVGKLASAPASGREIIVKLLVVTADPAAVLKTLDPYRQERQLAPVMAKVAKPAPVAAAAAKPPAGTEGKAQRKSEEKATDIMAESKAQGQATITTVTLWVPAGEYSELLKKVKVLGEITNETRPADKAQRGARDTHSVSNQSPELISVQIRIQPR